MFSSLNRKQPMKGYCVDVASLTALITFTSVMITDLSTVAGLLTDDSSSAGSSSEPELPGAPADPLAPLAPAATPDPAEGARVRGFEGLGVLLSGLSFSSSFLSLSFLLDSSFGSGSFLFDFRSNNSPATEGGTKSIPSALTQSAASLPSNGLAYWLWTVLASRVHALRTRRPLKTRLEQENMDELFRTDTFSFATVEGRSTNEFSVADKYQEYIAKYGLAETFSPLAQSSSLV
ncbi:hypothetical protein OGATHE_003985 [Ogataea polymorpha]|uniref:Uncharacterized protein n=1 Tax=Ogataea polymorpha TaxID=460523 RepID=A0A9P8P521_9ASCO|nr:hypothetical protein OGATHE_003985 [Ogataea polymorpha]